LPGAPGPSARAPRAGTGGLRDESAPGARTRLLLPDGLRGRRQRARRAERGGRRRALRRAGGGARRPGRPRRRLRARARAPRHGGARGRGRGGGSGRRDPPARGRRDRARACTLAAGDDRGRGVSAPIEPLGDWRCSDPCGTLRPTDIGRAVTLCGWVHARRDHGGVLFIDLRDRSGLVQVVCNPAESPAAHARAGEVRLEYVIAVRGEVRARPPETVNVELPTGAIEVSVRELRVLNTARPTPYPIDDVTEVSEPNRLRYRYLDLRRPHVQRNLLLRHEVTRAVREHLNAAGFVEVETPVLTRST